MREHVSKLHNNEIDLFIEKYVRPCQLKRNESNILLCANNSYDSGHYSVGSQSIDESRSKSMTKVTSKDTDTAKYITTIMIYGDCWANSSQINSHVVRSQTLPRNVSSKKVTVNSNFAKASHNY